MPIQVNLPCVDWPSCFMRAIIPVRWRAKFYIKVSIIDLNIRTGAGMNYAKTGKYTGVGVFTITEVKAGIGSTLGWGKLKSGAGWISLTDIMVNQIHDFL